MTRSRPVRAGAGLRAADAAVKAAPTSIGGALARTRRKPRAGPVLRDRLNPGRG